MRMYDDGLMIPISHVGKFILHSYTFIHGLDKSPQDFMAPFSHHFPIATLFKAMEFQMKASNAVGLSQQPGGLATRLGSAPETRR